MINLHWLYVLAGAVFAGFAIGSARDGTNPKRWGNAAFWALLAASFWFGDLPRRHRQRRARAGAGRDRRVASARPRIEAIDQRSRSASAVRERYGNRLFLPALIIPFTAFVGTLAVQLHAAQGLSGLIDPKAVTLVLLGCGVIIALVVCYVWLRPPALALSTRAAG